MKYGTRNEINLNPLDYNFALIGEAGIGKTTIIKEYCERLAGKDGYLFCEIGKEDGAEAISGIVSINCPDWDSDYQKQGHKEYIGFETLIDDIVENKASDWTELKVLVVDTYDELFSIAEPEVIAMHNRENPKNRVKSIKAAFGGFQGGEDKAIEIVLDKLWALKSVGVSFIVIGHTKTRNVTDPATGEEFLQLTTNMPQKYFNAIKTKVHFLGVAAYDRKIIKEKTGKKNLVTKEDIMKGVVTSETRRITFRDDNFVIDSKSRFADITESVPMNVDSLINAITEAIKAEHAKSGQSWEETKAQQEKEEIENLKMVAERETARKETKVLNNVITQITDFIKENKTNRDIIKPVIDKAKELGYENPIKIDNIEAANQVLKLIL